MKQLKTPLPSLPHHQVVSPHSCHHHTLLEGWLAALQSKRYGDTDFQKAKSLHTTIAGFVFSKPKGQRCLEPSMRSASFPSPGWPPQLEAVSGGSRNSSSNDLRTPVAESLTLGTNMFNDCHFESRDADLSH